MEKLVRDKIPKIIEKSTGKIPKTRILNKKEYKLALKNKLREELKEYEQSGNIEELADITEVISAILVTEKVSEGKFEKIRAGKAKKNGKFKKKILLVDY